jgi:hypothetical protein
VVLPAPPPPQKTPTHATKYHAEVC